MSEIKYEIIKKIGVLSKSALALSCVEGSGWAKDHPLRPASQGHLPQIRQLIVE
ncbi:MAG TPA: hypothetical protein VI753_04980 [Anaerolineales bacterium]|nr:hypothetical protein [Anaerolineales bacterium]